MSENKPQDCIYYTFVVALSLISCDIWPAAAFDFAMITSPEVTL